MVTMTIKLFSLLLNNYNIFTNIMNNNVNILYVGYLIHSPMKGLFNPQGSWDTQVENQSSIGFLYWHQSIMRWASIYFSKIIKTSFKSPSSIQILFLRKIWNIIYWSSYSENKRSSILLATIPALYRGTTFWSSPWWPQSHISLIMCSLK